MSDLRLELTPTLAYDLVLTDSDLTLVDGDEAVAQNIVIRLKFFRREYFLDTRMGIPYRTDVFIKNPDLLLIRQIFRRAIETTAGVEEVTEFEAELDTTRRHLSIRFRAQLSSGTELVFDDFILDI